MRVNRWRAIVSDYGVCIALCVATLAGCDNLRHGAVVQSASISPKPVSRISVPLPVRALLIPSGEPDCELKTTDPNADDRQKLDYERQCYRHAEIIARDRVRHLQSSVRRMARAINRCQWFAAQPGGLKPFDMTGTLTE
jgi:hypothetical protein